MIKVIFKIPSGDRIATISLDLANRKIVNIEIEKDRSRIAKLYYPHINKPTYASFESLLNHYCDTENVDLSILLDHIEKNGFYTPYCPTLRIEINR